MRIFLAFSAALWLPYGLYCFADPGSLAEAAGVAAGSATGTTELRAMYGGLQAAIGALALAALFRVTLRRPALLCIAFLCTGLFTARLMGALLDGSFSSYTGMGLAFESGSAAIAAWLLARSTDAADTAGPASA
jgi:hypothetical protein